MIAGTALIATVYQEAGGIRRWLDALAAQTAAPEEFIVVDGGSIDDTVAQITNYRWPDGFPKPRVIIQRCNIAAGRNLAIRNTAQPIIISTDAGSLPEPAWLEKMATPLVHDPAISVVGGESTCVLRNEFQQSLASYLGTSPVTSETVMPSSRCIAFRREAWAAVGGYPEWLTLTAEDSLFNYNLRAAGLRFHYAPEAVVAWEARPDLKSYLLMMYRYGYGSAEAGLAADQYRRWLATALFPPLILLSRRPLIDAPFRYLRNLASAAGWTLGKLLGHKPPTGWTLREGILLSPEAARFIETHVSNRT
jgi:cellulose synthase/poly-beta-1,6-N-acetylglucosamine synthase-like glycosyltransferase